MVEALAESEDALRRVATTCIALSDLLDKPYPDDPRWTPYTRFVKPALQRVERARHCARAVLGGEVQGRSDTSELAALEAIWQEANRYVLNEDDAQARHQRIVDLATAELVKAGVLTPPASTSNDRGDE